MRRSTARTIPPRRRCARITWRRRSGRGNWLWQSGDARVGVRRRDAACLAETEIPEYRGDSGHINGRYDMSLWIRGVWLVLGLALAAIGSAAPAGCAGTGAGTGAAAGDPAASEAAKGFVRLDNGKNLDGWVGVVDGYMVNKEGNIQCRPGRGGNLMTRGEYGDFELRFEFRLPPGGNNGIGVRAPVEGDAAYLGMEIQVLDDAAPQYANLHPYQYHGSIYGVVPARRGYLRPTGEWNSERILANGPHIEVWLNGTKITDADLSKISTTPDGRQHPGLHNAKGHVGFLGHNHPVEFRNVRIREIASGL